MAKRGRKSTFNDKIGETIIRLLKEGRTEAEIADLIGVSTRTLLNWKGKHQDLVLAIREAKFIADELVEASLYHRALGYSHPAEKIMVHKDMGVIREPYIEHYPPDTTAAMFWLRNRQPKKWREKTEGDVTVNNNLSVEKLTDEQLDARIAAMAAKNQAKEIDHGKKVDSEDGPKKRGIKK